MLLWNVALPLLPLFLCTAAFPLRPLAGGDLAGVDFVGDLGVATRRVGGVPAEERDFVTAVWRRAGEAVEVEQFGDVDSLCPVIIQTTLSVPLLLLLLGKFAVTTSCLYKGPLPSFMRTTRFPSVLVTQVCPVLRTNKLYPTCAGRTSKTVALLSLSASNKKVFVKLDAKKSPLGSTSNRKYLLA